MSTLSDVFPATEGTARSAQPSDLRRQNVAAVMRTVLTQGPIARADVARLTGLAPGSVTKLTARLVATGLLREEPSEPAVRQPGRPRVPVSIDPRHQVIGVQIGLHMTVVGVVDLTGQVVKKVTLPHNGETAHEPIVDQIVTQVRRQARASQGRILGVGVSTGGWVDPESGCVIEHPVLGWRDVPLRALLAQRLDYPVYLDSTVRAMALAESWFGAGRGLRSLLHLFVGNIVGAALVTEGRPYRGPRSAAGYIDHLPVGVHTEVRCQCGRYDCLQAVASDVAVLTEANESGVLAAGGSLDDLAALAAEGDERADALLRKRHRYVGYALALLVEILNPERVFLGGGIADHAQYIPELREAMVERLHRKLDIDPTDLVRASSFGRPAAMFASATLFLDAYYRDPMAFPPLTSDVA